MTQDNDRSKTFEWLRIFTSRVLLLGLAVAAAIALAMFALNVPEYRRLLANLALAAACAVALAWVGRRLAPLRINKPHAEMLSIIQGVGVAGASFAVLISAATLQTTDWRHAAGSVVVHLLAGVFGAAMSAAAAILCYWPVHAVGGRFLGVELPAQGAAIGGLAGIATSAAFLHAVYPWLIPAAGMLFALYGYRAAVLYEQLRRRPADESRSVER